MFYNLIQNDIFHIKRLCYVFFYIYIYNDIKRLIKIFKEIKYTIESCTCITCSYRNLDDIKFFDFFLLDI